MHRRNVFLVLMALAVPSISQGQTEVPRADAPSLVLLRQALHLTSAQDKLAALQASGDGDSAAAVGLRLTLLQQVLRASFDVDSVLGRIDTEATYMNEDAHALQVKAQRETTILNVATFAASGALGAAGSAMQLTRGLNHAGTAFQAAAGGTSLILSAVQLKGLSGGSKAIRSPYNMLAPLLDRTPNADSVYPPAVLAYLNTPPSAGKPALDVGLVDAWHRLHRVQAVAKDQGASVDDLTADRTSDKKLNADTLADREAMLHDLHAAIVLMRLDLQKILIASEAPTAP